ncbi:Bug family tripartite tricarboxylate transporter substrate binding protein [Bordetella bronchialis]|uniref:Twin-arginine translocation pathway signal protein n=1 Tax=Bordetella bronchialis TaxID=463025 RepID=A0A193FUJ2_9BORD|nr:tripartite tricarboxylate transporter substrate binding protein [Bordetella bronchialis]ANN70709.1 twin-arginine translocation pathway signal protein [Bordetella bronchialis]
MNRKALLAGMLACGLLAASPLIAHAQAEPAFPKVMTMVVPFPPGGSNDVFARVLAERLSARLHNSVIVENRPGAGGSIGADYVARAPKDGSVLMLSSSTFTTNAAVQPKLQYDVVKDFSPIAMLASSPMAITVGKASKYDSLASLLDAARAQPGKLSYGSAGIGSVNQMASEILAGMAKVSFMHVPYKGMSPAMNDLAAERVDMIVASFASISAMLKSDRVRVLAVTSPQRSPFYPDLPAASDTVPGYAVQLWWGVLGPAGLPQAMVQKLNSEIRAVVAEPRMRDMFAAESAVPSELSVAQFADLVKRDAATWKQVARDRNISVE